MDLPDLPELPATRHLIERIMEPLAITVTAGELQDLQTALWLAADAVAYLNGGEMSDYMKHRFLHDPDGILDGELKGWDELAQRLELIADRAAQSRRRAHEAASDEARRLRGT